MAVTIIPIGCGKIVASIGSSHGYPAVIIEASKEVDGVVGEYAPEENYKSFEDDSIVLEIHDLSGLKVILENAELAVTKYPTANQ